jgi:hypothetical protein
MHRKLHQFQWIITSTTPTVHKMKHIIMCKILNIFGGCNRIWFRDIVMWDSVIIRFFYWYSSRQQNKYFKINQSKCSYEFYLITAMCFGPYFGPSSGSFIKYVLHYWNIPIWIHISVNHYNHHNTCNYY